MAVLQIRNFGGEAPRVPPRQLSGDAAQVNENLLATSSDFRPVLKPSDVAAAENGAATLYRTQLGTDGKPHTEITKGWYTSTGDFNLVRGQINGSDVERTYKSDNTGLTPPRVLNNDGTSYRLGIPAPGSNDGPPSTWSKPEVLLLKATPFTYEQANDWLANTLVPKVHDLMMGALSEDQTTARWSVPDGAMFPPAGAPASVAGVTKALDPLWQKYPKMVDSSTKKGSQRGQDEPWNMMVRINKAYTVCDSNGVPVDGLANPQIGASASRQDGPFGPLDSSELTSNSPVWIGVPAFPLWGVLDKAALKAALKKIESPDGCQPFLWESDAKAQAMVDKLADLVSPDTTAVTAKRRELDAIVHEFGVAAIESIKHSNDKPATGIADYDAKMVVWKKIHADAVAAMMDAQTRAGDVSHAIEQMYIDIKTDLSNVLRDFFGGVRLVKTEDNDDGLVVISTPATETRFYITTFVSAAGEESAPSAISRRLDVDSNDVVVIRPPRNIPADRNITKWRIYRTNTSSQGAAFQFVAERVLGGDLWLSPRTTPAVGSVNGLITGFETTHKWRDLVANWQMMVDRGVVTSNYEDYLDTKLLRIGDTATQQDERAGKTYSITKRWNGDAWVMQKVPDTTPYAWQEVYIDGKYGSSLGEPCPTLTWAPPPANIQGLVNMPNGVMAGFFGNTVAFCEPYTPYAWPVEYQIPTEHPIVGLCAFGQSLIVGTSGNPCIISGADSASMSMQKMDSPQSCVSRRSMVAAMDGVFYASPDGYCFANQGGVQVVTTGLFSNEDWAALVPASIFAVVHDNVLYFWYSGNGGGCYGLDFVSKKLTRHDIKATAVFDDVVTDYSYATYMGRVVKLFSGARATGRWKSGKVTLPQPAPLAWLQVLSDFEAGPVTVKWFGDGVLRHTATVASIAPTRLPAGRYLEHEVEVISASRTTSAMLAGSTDELKAV